MMKKMKKLLLHLACALVLLVGATGCEGLEINWGSGNGDDNKTEEVGIVLTRCWHLKSFCGMPAEMDIYIDFAKDGNFTIYQRTDKLTYTKFDGTYTVDEANSLLGGVYSDGTSWTSSYLYTLDKEAEELVLESVATPAEVSVYEPSNVPTSATLKTRNASVSDVKPL